MSWSHGRCRDDPRFDACVPPGARRQQGRVVRIAQTFYYKHFDPEGLYFTARVLARLDERGEPRLARAHHPTGVLLVRDAAGSVDGFDSQPLALRRGCRARRRANTRGARIPPAQRRSAARPMPDCELFRAAAKDSPTQAVLPIQNNAFLRHSDPRPTGAAFAQAFGDLMRRGIFAAAVFLWLAALISGTAAQRLPAALLRNHPAISCELRSPMPCPD